MGGGAWETRRTSTVSDIGVLVNEIFFYPRYDICTPYIISRIVYRFRNEQLLLQRAVTDVRNCPGIVMQGSSLEINVAALDARAFVAA